MKPNGCKAEERKLALPALKWTNKEPGTRSYSSEAAWLGNAFIMKSTSALIC
jgi:hypothetical protein